MKIIESSANGTVKLIKSLKLSKYRKETGLYIVEGERLVEEAINYKSPKYIVYSKSFIGSIELEDTDDKVVVVSDNIFDSMCDTKTPQGILAVMEMETDSNMVNDGIIVAMENVQNPLNVGTIIRTADALGASGVLMSSECADIYSPKVLRGTMGSVYHIPVVKTENFYERLMDYKEKGFKLIAGDLQGGPLKPIQGNSIMVVGNEGNGITERLRKMCDILWKINMPGKAESLNAAVAAGIMLYTLTN